MMPNQPMPQGLASPPSMQPSQGPGALPPGLGQQQQGIPLTQLLPNADQIQKTLQQSVPAPAPLVKDADQSTGLHPENTAVDDLSGQDDGLPGHRLVEMYNAWEMAKLFELTNQLRYEQFYHGKQWTDEELDILKERSQPNTYFNELRKKIDSYVGIEQRLRRDPKAQPRSPKHEGDCDAATAALREINQLTNSPLKFSEAGRDFFVRGIGAMWQGVERKTSGQIEIVKRRIAGFNFIYDPRSLEYDFSDAKFIGEWGFVDVEDARDMFEDLGRSDSAEKVQQLVGNLGSAMSGTSTGLPGEWARLRGEWYNRQLQRIRLVHLYYRYKRQWRCAYFCGYIKLYDAPSIYKDEDGGSRHPINAVSCNVDEVGERYGVAKDLIPIQEAINVRSSKLTWLINARQLIYEEGAIGDKDVNNVRKQFNRPNGIIKLNPGGIAKIKVEQLTTEIEGQAKLLEQAIEMMRNYGPNPSLIGKDNQEASGRAILARQNSGMTEMSPVFERHREFKIKAYKKDWLLVRQFWTQERWLRTTDDDKGFSFLPLNQYVFDPQQMKLTKKNNVALMDIDIIIDEGPDVITMNEELMDLLGKLGQSAATPIGKVMIELSSVRNKDRLIKLLDEATKPPPQDPDMADLLKKKNFLEVARQAVEIDEKLASVENKRATTLKTLNDGLIDSNAMQAFPFEYGARTAYEDFLGEPLHPQGNPNVFAPNMPQPQMPAGPQGAMPSAPLMPSHPASRMPNLPQGKNAIGMDPPPVLPNQEPHLGQPGGLPLPAAGSSGAAALMPPSNTRL